MSAESPASNELRTGIAAFLAEDDSTSQVAAFLAGEEVRTGVAAFLTGRSGRGALRVAVRLGNGEGAVNLQSSAVARHLAAARAPRPSEHVARTSTEGSACHVTFPSAALAHRSGTDPSTPANRHSSVDATRSMRPIATRTARLGRERRQIRQSHDERQAIEADERISRITVAVVSLMRSCSSQRRHQ